MHPSSSPVVPRGQVDGDGVVGGRGHTMSWGRRRSVTWPSSSPTDYSSSMRNPRSALRVAVGEDGTWEHAPMSSPRETTASLSLLIQLGKASVFRIMHSYYTIPLCFISSFTFYSFVWCWDRWEIMHLDNTAATKPDDKASFIFQSVSIFLFCLL